MERDGGRKEREKKDEGKSSEGSRWSCFCLIKGGANIRGDFILMLFFSLLICFASMNVLYVHTYSKSDVIVFEDGVSLSELVECSVCLHT